MYIVIRIGVMIELANEQEYDVVIGDSILSQDGKSVRFKAWSSSRKGRRPATLPDLIKRSGEIANWPR